jgi:hypothetical protein
VRAPQYEIQLDLRLPALNRTKLSGAKIADIAQFLPDVRKPKRASQLPAQSARGFAAHDRPPPVPQVLREKGLQPDASAGLPVLHIQAAQNEIGDVGAGALVDALLQLKRENVAAVRRVFLFRNRIGDEGARRIAELIRESSSADATAEWLTEVHLSHNEITAAGAHALFAAASSYPRGAAPLWLRLEYNLIQIPPASMPAHCLATARGKANGRAGGRHRLVQEGDCGVQQCGLAAPPPLHLYAFTNQKVTGESVVAGGAGGAAVAAGANAPVAAGGRKPGGEAGGKRGPHEASAPRRGGAKQPTAQVSTPPAEGRGAAENAHGRGKGGAKTGQDGLVSDALRRAQLVVTRTEELAALVEILACCTRFALPLRPACPISTG